MNQNPTQKKTNGTNPWKNHFKCAWGGVVVGQIERWVSILDLGGREIKHSFSIDTLVSEMKQQFQVLCRTEWGMEIPQWRKISVQDDEEKLIDNLSKLRFLNNGIHMYAIV